MGDEKKNNNDTKILIAAIAGVVALFLVPIIVFAAIWFSALNLIKTVATTEGTTSSYSSDKNSFNTDDRDFIYLACSIIGNSSLEQDLAIRDGLLNGDYDEVMNEIDYVLKHDEESDVILINGLDSEYEFLGGTCNGMCYANLEEYIDWVPIAYICLTYDDSKDAGRNFDSTYEYYSEEVGSYSYMHLGKTGSLSFITGTDKMNDTKMYRMTKFVLDNDTIYLSVYWTPDWTGKAPYDEMPYGNIIHNSTNEETL